MQRIETDRLIIRWLTENDAPFICELFNTELFLKFVGDKNIRSVEDAKHYLINGPINMYQRLGIGLYMVELKANTLPIGICGLIKRDSLDDIDLGYGFLPKYFGFGYAYEASKAVVKYAKTEHKLKRLVAITSPNNTASIKLLNKLGFLFEKNLPTTKNSLITSLYEINF